MASETGVRHVLDQYRTDLSTVDVAAEESEVEAEKIETNSIKTIVQDSPISRALSTILEYAVKAKASDVHIEPLESALKIRCRVDGVLREIMQLPKTIEPALVSRIFQASRAILIISCCCFTIEMFFYKNSNSYMNFI